MKVIVVSFLLAVSTAASAFAAESKIPVLIVDGYNNHDWKTTTGAIRATLESTGIFKVSVSTVPEIKIHSIHRSRSFEDEATRNAFEEELAHYNKASKVAHAKVAEQWANWLPDFSQYQAVIMNFKGGSWPEPMQTAFVEYMKNGGGLVLVHASNNAFGSWEEFNEIIGLGYNGARGGATESTKIDPETGEPILLCPNQKSGHGSMHPFTVTVRQPLHPIMRLIPRQWKHGKDELYHNLRGPGKHLQILSSAYSEPKTRGTGHHEPITYTTKYGEGRCVVTTMGHFWPGQTDWDSLYCVGFQTILARSVEYVATGRVSLDVPPEFPSAEATSIVPPHQVTWKVNGQPTSLTSSRSTDWRKKKEEDEFCLLSPEEAADAMVLPDEFVIEAVASEPMVQEPVLAVWDANGAMYVAEMRSYMQNASGEGTKTMRNGRIKRLTDEDGDGIMDKATVFVDGLNLPRMILPLDDRIAVVETDHTTVWSYRDSDGDGIADEKELLFEGKPGSPGKSVEHQNSGLIWNLDNWIYTSYGKERFRYTDGTWRAESTLGHWAQWGLDRDDEGRIFYSDNRSPAKSVQMDRIYWNHITRASVGKNPKFTPTIGEPYTPDFLVAKNIAKISDRGGEAAARKGFTSTCGQSFYRGDRFPESYRGDYFVCDPTIHVVRRAKVENRNGKVFLTNPHGEDEFLLSSDFNFRPVNTSTGPDGCLYIVDMYRGIIQDAPWYNEDARKFATESGIVDHIQNGRIWRIRHRDHLPAPVPRMLEESTVELVRHFESPNGWIRDTAQKTILLREDRESVAPILQGVVRFDGRAPLFRLHALWTLEGMNLAEEVLPFALQDRDPKRPVSPEICINICINGPFPSIPLMHSSKGNRLVSR